MGLRLVFLGVLGPLGTMLGCQGASSPAMDEIRPVGPTVSREGSANAAGSASPADRGPLQDAGSAPGLAPVPVLSSISPEELVVGAPPPTLVAKGRGFSPMSMLQVDGVDLPTVFLGPGELRGALPSKAVVKTGMLRITVDTPPPGGGRSAALGLAVTNPVPLLTVLRPSSALVGAGETSVEFEGEGFVPGTVALMGDAELPTEWLSAKGLRTRIPSSLLASSGVFPMKARNPGPGGGVSGERGFVVANPSDISIFSLSPAEVPVGATGVRLQVRGRGFVPTSVVSLNATKLPTQFRDEGSVEAQVLDSLLMQAGEMSVVVAHVQPSGATSVSTPATLRVVHPVPMLTGLDPEQVPWGTPGREVRLFGKGFVAGSVVSVAGQRVATARVSDTELTASLGSSFFDLARFLDLRVDNPGPGGGASGTVNLRVVNPVPMVSAPMQPDLVEAGSADVDVRVMGQGFTPTSVVKVNGLPRTTSFLSKTELGFVMPASSLATAGTVSVTISNPPPGGGDASGLSFRVVNPIPSATALAPSSVLVGSSSFALEIVGRGFVPGAEVNAGGTALRPSLSGASRLVVTVPSALLTSSGAIPIRVINPSPGGGSSSPISLTVANPVGSLSGLSPKAVTLGASRVSVSVTGTGFVGTSRLVFNGTEVPTTYVSSRELQGVLPGPLDEAGDFPVAVSTPPPGGGMTSSLTFSVLHAVPSLSLVEPSAVPQGLGDQTITLRGTGFVAGATTVNVSGANPPTTVVNATEIRVTLSAALLSSAGTLTIYVQNPSPGGGRSGQKNLTVTAGCDRTGVDVVLTSLDPTIAMSTAMAVQLEGRAVASRLMAGTCPLANLSSAKSPLQTFVVQNASSGPAVLSVWAACTGVQGDEDGFLAIYKRSVAVPTAIPMTDAERLACTGRVSEGSSGTTRLGSLETGGSAWCPGLTKANGAGVALQRCERAVVQVQAYDVASTDYPPPKTLKFRLESP